jgi:biotin carboxylase
VTPTPGGPGVDELPLLAVPQFASPLSPLTLSEAARGLCRLLWLVDPDGPVADRNRRVLSRLGTVVELPGQDPAVWAEAVAAHAPEAMAAFSDHHLLRLARMAVLAGVAFHSPQTAMRLTDKGVQRRALAAGGLPVPRSASIAAGAGEADIRAAADAMSFPVVAKPQRGNDSRGVRSFERLEDLLAGLRPEGGTGAGRAGRVSTEPVSTEPVSTEPVLIEEYLADTFPLLGDGFANYLSVESAVGAGKVSHFALTGRFPPAAPFRETGFFIPSTVGGAQLAEVLAVAGAAVAAMGVERGCLHTEIKFTPDGARVIEVNGRLGGGVPLMLDLAGGLDATRLAMHAALGAAPPAGRAPLTSIGFRYLVQAPMEAARITAVDGLDAVAGIEGVSSVVLHRGPGSSVSWRTGNHDYVFAVAGAVADHDHLRRVEAEILRLGRIAFDPHDENGES